MKLRKYEVGQRVEVHDGVKGSHWRSGRVTGVRELPNGDWEVAVDAEGRTHPVYITHKNSIRAM